ncbi:peptidase S8/S53 domain-containing protein [Diaporthe sp. PMI_573]|nr:peptidase S8/S53 domain-containing protein [Diaporthaceae sp. PMI_573]
MERTAVNSPSLAFAAEATLALRKIVQSLAKLLKKPEPSLRQPNSGVKRPSPFFSKIATHLGGAGKRFDELRDNICRRGSPEEEILDFLAVLEGLAKGRFRSPSATTRRFNRNSYPELNLILSGYSHNAKKHIKDLGEENPKYASDRKRFQETLKKFAASQESQQGHSLSDLTTSHSKPHRDEDWSGYVQELHWTICRLCLCSSPEDCDVSCFRANFGLTRVDQPAAERDGVVFNIFFSHRHLDDPGDIMQWKETRISVVLSSDETKTQTVQWTESSSRISSEDFCSLVRDEAMGRLVLRAFGGTLDFKDREMQDRIILKAPSVSLATMLDRRRLKDDIQLKVQLSYLLAKAVWQFYDSNWMAEDWTKDTVHFMQERRIGMAGPNDVFALVHKPLIAAEMRLSAEPSKSVPQQGSHAGEKPAKKFSGPTHIYPKILALGTILIEILRGEGLPLTTECIGKDRRERLNAQHTLAGNVILTGLWNEPNKQKDRSTVKDLLKALIKICVQPDRDRLGTDPAQVRGRLYTHVVAPLRQLFRDSWPDMKEPEDFEPDPVMLEGAPNARHDGPRFTGIKMAPEKLRDNKLNANAMLFDARKPVGDESTANGWIKWVNEFTAFRERILPDTVGVEFDSENKQRIRVTVIDTGIDSSHPYIRGKKWTGYDEYATEPHLFCDFVRAASDPTRHGPVDEDGHGTFIAGLLLRLAPDVELSIARIGVTRQSIEKDDQIGKKVGLAIRHAVETWETNIISMSFGCWDMSPDIRDAIIEKAIPKKVIVLAAAGNSGNHRGIAYPAREDGVLKIFAANSDGYAAPFSPPVDFYYSDLSYFIYGCGVVSTWPWTKLQTTQEEGLPVFCYGPNDNHEHSPNCDMRTVMSGTSFATPIAAALVALIYQFHDTNKVWLRPGSEKLFKTPKAVRVILQNMSRTSPGAKYNLLEPWRGGDNRFEFIPFKHPGRQDISPPLNVDGRTAVEFFKETLKGILYKAEI